MVYFCNLGVGLIQKTYLYENNQKQSLFYNLSAI